MSKAKKLAVVNVVGFLLVLIVNYVSQRGGENTSKISDSIDILFKPANYAFSIWGLIYLLLGTWVIRQFFATGNEAAMYERIGYWFFINCVLNSLWVILFAYKKFNLTLLCMLGILATLIVIYQKIQKSDVSRLYRLPFSIYLGWISVATIVNVFIVFYTNEITSFLGLNEQAWTIIMLIIGGVLGIWFTNKNNDLAYSLVFVWAYIAIMTRYELTDYIYRTALVMVVLLSVNAVWQLVKRTVKKK
ncbi:tryptophan-rich sensory protein [Ectobacillus sp. JY-23]|uniref:tryptophan-rich sensory protein n=1 Tax=Ectobacillus sp. JY-23 TaxID=2933872 RepID=UPI001FF32B4A|nr:tryptophan-rich sensory protein [Ectobacillus sp. JY-23]UOY91534.1 tryptophan-rich sensory protein [Ectobacillus sp. JY-23]